MDIDKGVEAVEHNTSLRGMMDRRTFINRAGATVATAAALGAGAGTLLEATPPADAATTITLWAFADNRIKWMKSLTPGFTKLYPQANIKIVSVPYANLWPKLSTVFTANAGVPDMVDMAVGQLGPFVGGDSVPFASLDAYLGSRKSALNEAAGTAPWTYKGKVYGISNEYNPVMMYYRWDLFQKAGIDPASIKMWTDFVEAGKQLKAKTGTAMVGLPTNDYAYWYFIARQRSGGFFDAAGNITVNNDIGVSALQFLVDMVYKSKIAILDPAGDEYSPPYYTLLTNGAAATVLGAPWYQGFMHDNAPKGAGKWEITFMPRWDQHSARTVMFGGTGLAITQVAKQKDLCWKFIEYCMLRPESQLRAYTLENLDPTLTALYSKPDLQKSDPYFHNQKPGKYMKDLLTTPANGYVVNLYESPMYDAMGRLAMTPVMRGKTSPKKGLDAVAAAVRKFIG